MEELDAVHAGHVDVAQDQIVIRPRGELLEGVLPIGADIHLQRDAGLGDGFAEQSQVGAVVIDSQDSVDGVHAYWIDE
jgi:hypothetical protein